MEELLLAGLTHSLWVPRALEPRPGSRVCELRESPDGVISILGLEAGMFPVFEGSPKEPNTTSVRFSVVGPWEGGFWLDAGWLEVETYTD